MGISPGGIVTAPDAPPTPFPTRYPPMQFILKGVSRPLQPYSFIHVLLIFSYTLALILHNVEQAYCLNGKGHAKSASPALLGNYHLQLHLSLQLQ